MTSYSPAIHHAATAPASARRLAAVLPGVFALVFGVFMIYGVGFANSQAVHDAAHDTRHAIGFPCH